MAPDSVPHAASDRAGTLFAIDTVDFESAAAEQAQHLPVLLAVFLELELATLLVLHGLRLFSILASFSSGSWHTYITAFLSFF